MTLYDHIVKIGELLGKKEVSNRDTLLFQLYLLCLGKAGRRKDCQLVLDFIHNDQKRLKELIEPLWVLATDNFSAEKDSPMWNFFHDGELDDLEEEDYRQVFEDLLGRFSRSRITGFGHMQPKELTGLVYNLSGYVSGMTVYNPYAGVASYACSFAIGDNYYGEEIDAFAWAIGVLRMCVASFKCKIPGFGDHVVDSQNFILGDSFHPKWTREFDIIVSTPPTESVSYSSNGSNDYLDNIIQMAKPYLKSNGALLLVSSDYQIEKHSRALLDSGMLDMVLTLPVSLFGDRKFTIIVRLKKGRNAMDPVLVGDFSSFYYREWRHPDVQLDSFGIINALNQDDSFFTKHVPLETIRRSDGQLTPSAYIFQDALNGEGGVVPLRDLGRFLSLPAKRVDQGEFPSIDRTDLYSERTDALIEPHPSDSDAPYKIVTQPAVLLYANHHGLRFGYVEASDEQPVAIEVCVQVFVPDQTKVLIPYFFSQLSKAQALFIGHRFAASISVDQLSDTRLHIIPLNEQKKLLENDLERVMESARLLGISQTYNGQRTPVVAVLGHALPENIGTNVNVFRTYSKGWDAVGDISNIKKSIDAFIINQPTVDNETATIALCNMIPEMTFVISDEPSLLAEMEKKANDVYQHHCFKPAEYSMLFEHVLRCMKESHSPDVLVRNRYSSQLMAVEKLERMFPQQFKNVKTTILKIIISNLHEDDWINSFRTIRNKCLEILSQYRYVPPFGRKGIPMARMKGLGSGIDIGAVTDLLADRVYVPEHSNSFIVLLKDPLENEALGSMLKAAKSFMNVGSHGLLNNSKEIQEALLQILFALIMRLSEMIDQGCFEQIRQGESLGYWTVISNEEHAVEGLVRVADVNETSYYYVGNVHLDSSKCVELGIHEGDSVRILKTNPEKKPVLPDVWFYSKAFSKASTID